MGVYTAKEFPITNPPFDDGKSFVVRLYIRLNEVTAPQEGCGLIASMMFRNPNTPAQEIYAECSYTMEAKAQVRAINAQTQAGCLLCYLEPNEWEAFTVRQIDNYIKFWIGHASEAVSPKVCVTCDHADGTGMFYWGVVHTLVEDNHTSFIADVDLILYDFYGYINGEWSHLYPDDFDMEERTDSDGYTVIKQYYIKNPTGIDPDHLCWCINYRTEIE